MKKFICRYFHSGQWWSMNIFADSWEDAEARIAKLGNLQLQGEVKFSFSAPSFLAPLINRFLGFLIP